jgi:hypothetical protein
LGALYIAFIEGDRGSISGRWWKKLVSLSVKIMACHKISKMALANPKGGDGGEFRLALKYEGFDDQQ